MDVEMLHYRVLLLTVRCELAKTTTTTEAECFCLITYAQVDVCIDRYQRSTAIFPYNNARSDVLPLPL